MIIDARKGQRVYIGRIGENETRQIRFDIRRIREEFPDAELSFLNKRPTDADAYPVNGQYITVDGGYLYWKVQSGDLEYVGFGECEIKATKNGQVLKDEIYQTQIKRALDGNGNPPEPWESWQQQVADDADRAEAAAALLENPGAEAETLAPGSSATAAYAEGVFTFGIPKGEKGDTGDPGRDGQDGFSPTAAVSKSGSTATITITDKNGTTTAEVSDGQDGAPGQDGADGFSPTATVSKSGSTATISITDKNGTTTAQISDGNPATIIDDTSTAQNKTWSASKSNDLKSALLRKYTDTSLWESGTISGATGAEATNANRIRTKNYVEKGVGVSPMNGYSVMVFAYDPSDDYAFVGYFNGSSYTKELSANWISSDVFFTSLPGSYVYKLAVKNPGGTAVSESDSVNTPFIITTDDTLTQTNFAADAKAVGNLLTNQQGQITDLKSAINGVEESIAPVESTATATAAHAIGELFMLGDSLLVALSAIAVGDTITTTGATPNAAVTTLSAKLIRDVQVNGVSVLSNGVANVPLTATNTPGVCRPSNDGIQTNANGQLFTKRASTNEIKAGSNVGNVICPPNQHESIYYGLAKLAGANMSSVTGETVGVYPEAQKKAICKMIGVPYPHGELIRDYTTTVDQTEVIINTDESNQSFELVKVKIIVIIPSTTTGAASNFFADVLTINELNGNDDTYKLPTMQAPAAGRYFFYEFETYGGYLTFSRSYLGTGYNSTNTNFYTYVADKTPRSITGFKFSQYSSTSSLVPSGTRILIYGMRA